MNIMITHQIMLILILIIRQITLILMGIKGIILILILDWCVAQNAWIPKTSVRESGLDMSSKEWSHAEMEILWLAQKVENFVGIP